MWKDLLALGILYYAIVIAITFFGWFLVVQVVCGLFGIEFSMEYVIGIWAASIIIKMAYK